jgi:cytochrome oxidase assembly protein ShyY1
MADAAGDVAVVAPLVTDSGSAVLVVRGRSENRPAAPPPTGRVRVNGVLEPSQNAAAALDRSRTTDGIQIARLVSSFHQDLYAGYVIARSSTPPDALPAAPVPEPDASFWAGFRNLLYALQWWAFAGFAVFMWWRVIREPPGDARSDDDRHLVGSTPPAGADSDVG